MGGNPTKLRRAFGLALRQVRKARGLTQEDFSDTSSRTYVSSLERGMKSPTLDKVERLAETLKVHPLTLLSSAYFQTVRDEQLEQAWNRIVKELRELRAATKR